MDQVTSQMLELRRLIRKFFPESKATVHLDKPMGIYSLVTAMSWAGCKADYSCQASTSIEDSPDLGLAGKGGVWDEDEVIYQRLLDHTGFTPSGRVVIIPDDFCSFQRNPIVCHSSTAVDRVGEFSDKYTGPSACRSFFDNVSDIAFVYESGAMVLDHDQRFFWAKSAARS